MTAADLPSLGFLLGIMKRGIGIPETGAEARR
jgi:hypothetical protein